MTDKTPAGSAYIHGSSPEEQRRLSLMNDILNASCLKELNPQPKESVVDFGSGLGQFSRLIARAVGRNARVVGIERDPDQIAQANRLADEDGEAGRVEFRLGDAENLPLGAAEWGTFDLAHARFLLDHLADPAAAIAQMVQAVRPGGRVVVIDDDHGDFRPWPEPPGFPAIWQAYVQYFERRGNDPYVGRRLVSLLHAGGLTNIRNTGVFFGGSAGNDVFQAVADNLIAALLGAKAAILSAKLLDEAAFQAGIDGLQQWKADPSAALWYAACYAEGVRPT